MPSDKVQHGIKMCRTTVFRVCHITKVKTRLRIRMDDVDNIVVVVLGSKETNSPYI